MATTMPKYRGLQVQPKGTLAPLLLVGHATAKHVLLKYGDDVVALTLPL